MRSRWRSELAIGASAPPDEPLHRHHARRYGPAVVVASGRRSDLPTTARRFRVVVEPAEFAASVLPPSSASGVGELKFHGDATNAWEEPEGSLFPNMPEGLDLQPVGVARVELRVSGRYHPEQDDVANRLRAGVEDFNDGDEPILSDLVFRSVPIDRFTSQRRRARGTGFRFVDGLERDTGFRHIDAFSLRPLVGDPLTFAPLRFELTCAVALGGVGCLDANGNLLFVVRGRVQGVCGVQVYRISDSRA